MKLPPELEDQYVKEVLYNRSLENLPDEEWKLIEGYEHYAISNYGRVKSLERWITDPKGRRRKAEDCIMQLQFMKFYNKYLNCNFYTITFLISSEGKRHRRSVARLVYYHFVGNFDLNSRTHVISFKDNNRFHIHEKNLEKLTISEERFKRVRTNTVKNSKSKYEKVVSQYTVAGDFIVTFESIDAAAETLGIGRRNIMAAVNNERHTAGGFRWIFKENDPENEDFENLNSILK